MEREQDGDLLDSLTDFLESWRFEIGSRTMTMRINGGQSTPGGKGSEENGPGENGAEEEGREEISA